MYKMMQATYEKGKLLLTEELGAQLEGQRLYVVIFKVNDHEHKKERFFDFVDKHSFSLPQTYQFNRDELYDR